MRKPPSHSAMANINATTRLCTCADDIEASVKRIHAMIEDLEKEGYDPREIGANF